MELREITNGGQAPGNGVIDCPSGKLGGLLISADGTNPATVTIRKDNSGGRAIVDAFNTRHSAFIAAPFEGADKLYWELAGTNARLQIYEWAD